MGSEFLKAREVTIDASGDSRRVDGALASAMPVTVYWRPGCPSCARLLSGLARLGVAHAAVDIWKDPDAAAHVRQVAYGNETVPTVLVGDRAFVDPSLDEVVEAMGGSLRSPAPPRRGELVFGGLVGLTVLISLAIEAAGHPGVSWALDGVALVFFAILRPALRRRRRGR